MRESCKQFPPKGFAICKISNGDILVTQAGVLMECNNGRTMNGYYRVTDVKLDNKPTSRVIFRVEGLIDSTQSKSYNTVAPKSQPSAQQITWLENDLGFKLSDEYKHFVKTRGAVQYDDFNTVGLPSGSYQLSVTSVLDDIEEFTDSKSVRIPKDAIPIIETSSYGIVLYLNNSKTIGYWVAGNGFSETGPATTIDEAMLQAILDGE